VLSRLVDRLPALLLLAAIALPLAFGRDPGRLAPRAGAALVLLLVYLGAGWRQRARASGPRP